MKSTTRLTQLLISIQKYKTLQALGQHMWPALVNGLPVTENMFRSSHNAGTARKRRATALTATQCGMHLHTPSTECANVTVKLRRQCCLGRVDRSHCCLGNRFTGLPVTR